MVSLIEQWALTAVWLGAIKYRRTLRPQRGKIEPPAMQHARREWTKHIDAVWHLLGDPPYPFGDL